MTRIQVENIRDLMLHTMNEKVTAFIGGDDNANIDIRAWEGMIELHRAACRHLDSMPRYADKTGATVDPLDLAVIHLAQAAMDHEEHRTYLGQVIFQVQRMKREGGGA